MQTKEEIARDEATHAAQFASPDSETRNTNERGSVSGAGSAHLDNANRMKSRKRPVIVEATQWFKNGDHPEDGTERFPPKGTPGQAFDGSPQDPRYTGEFAGELFEGKVVRYFRLPEMDGQDICMYCNRMMKDHGWIDTLGGGKTVCPGDWVITGKDGDHYPCKAAVFEKLYEEI
jgi:hypothetical protein